MVRTEANVGQFGIKAAPAAQALVTAGRVPAAQYRTYIRDAYLRLLRSAEGHYQAAGAGFAVLRDGFTANADVDVLVCLPVSVRLFGRTGERSAFAGTTVAYCATSGRSPAEIAAEYDALQRYAFAQDAIIAGDPREVIAPDGIVVELQVPVVL